MFKMKLDGITSNKDLPDANDDDIADENSTAKPSDGNGSGAPSPTTARSPSALRTPPAVRSPNSGRSPQSVRSPTALHSPIAVRSPIVVRSPNAVLRSPIAHRSPKGLRSPNSIRTSIIPPPAPRSPITVRSSKTPSILENTSLTCSPIDNTKSIPSSPKRIHTEQEDDVIPDSPQSTVPIDRNTMVIYSTQ